VIVGVNEDVMEGVSHWVTAPPVGGGGEEGSGVDVCDGSLRGDGRGGASQGRGVKVG